MTASGPKNNLNMKFKIQNLDGFKVITISENVSFYDFIFLAIILSNMYLLKIIAMSILKLLIIVTSKMIAVLKSLFLLHMFKGEKYQDNYSLFLCRDRKPPL